MQLEEPLWDNSITDTEEREKVVMGVVEVAGETWFLPALTAF